RASAMLGLAGFSMLDLIESEAPPRKIVKLLGLEPENVTEKRLLIAGAAIEVRDAESGNQAFALLVSAYLGLAVSVAEYLDNGAGSAMALDDVIEDSEVEDATGLTSRSGATLEFFQGSPIPFFQIVINTTPYLVVCGDYPTQPLEDSSEEEPTDIICDGFPPGTTSLFDDSDGSGRLDTANLPAPAVPEGGSPTLSGVSPVNLVVQMGDLLLPIAVNQAKLARMESFLGGEDPDGEYFTIGVSGYLDLLQAASDKLAEFSGSEGGDSIISENINATRSLLDNGGDCLAGDDAAGAALLDLLFAIYDSAPGTVRNPEPELVDFTFKNIAANSQLEAGGVQVPLSPEQFIFRAPIGFKFLYPIAVPANGFDVSNATPRVDEAAAAFRTEFENIPRLAPGGSEADDGDITFLELSCART
ncbi:MAG: hypothetical protein V3S64_03170, partial [bacterium]